MRAAAITTLVATVLTLPTAAHALPNIGAGDTLNIVGDATFDATSITFVNPGDVTPGTGAYTTLGTCTGCATMVTPFTYAPFTAGLIATAVNGGITATISLVSEILPPAQVGNDLDLTDQVLLTLTGFAPTDGTLDLTVNEATGIASGSFSATAQGSPVAEPASLAILGLGILGIAAARRTRMGTT